MKPALIIMCKAPLAGAVKTRLTPFLSPAKAAELALCLAVDAARRAQTICENVVVAFAGEKSLLENALPKNLMWIEQCGADLGERMHHAIEFAFQKNFSPLILIGTDSPTLPTEFIRAAIEILQEKRTDAILGATEDGGYYLIGLNEPNSLIFQNVLWSSPVTFLETVRNIKELNLHLKTLPVWYDVDEPRDLRRLQAEFETNPNLRDLAPATFAWFAENAGLFNSANEAFAADIE